MNNNINIELNIKYWVESSDKDFKTMMDLFDTKNNHWSLFIGHLVIEKLLKALFVKSMNEFPPLIHDLRRICEKANIEINDEQKINLDTITRFNINARYDDYKQNFYKLCDDEFTNTWIVRIKELREWIKMKL